LGLFGLGLGDQRTLDEIDALIDVGEIAMVAGGL
jgi:hypothetical protein